MAAPVVAIGPSEPAEPPKAREVRTLDAWTRIAFRTNAVLPLRQIALYPFHAWEMSGV